MLANDKWGLHFIETTDGEGSDQRLYSLEFLDKEGSYLGYTSIDDDFTTHQKTTSFFPKHLDDQNQLYYVDYSSGVPVIRITKIIMEE